MRLRVRQVNLDTPSIYDLTNPDGILDYAGCEEIGADKLAVHEPVDKELLEKSYQLARKMAGLSIENSDE